MRLRALAFVLLASAGAVAACPPDESSVGVVFAAEPSLAAECFEGRSFQRSCRRARCATSNREW